MIPNGVLRPSDRSQERITDALADVALATQRLIVDRAELLRLGVQRDARTYAVGLALGGAALTMVGIALVLGTAALAYALIPWLGIAASLAVTAGSAFALATGTTVAAFRVLKPASSPEPLALKAADGNDA